MKLAQVKSQIPEKLYTILDKNIEEFRPSQQKSIAAGLLERKNVLVCTPTASGKTLIAELAMLTAIFDGKGKAVYIVPLKALATEKYKQFKERYGHLIKVALTIGDTDNADSYLSEYDLIITTSEKLDSLTRHHSPWLASLSVVVVDEVHLLNDPGRGPTLEILLTILKQLIPSAQTVALSATIGNPQELADWLKAELVEDEWRPVKLEKGVYFNGKIKFEET